MAWPPLPVHQLRQDLDFVESVLKGYAEADSVKVQLARFLVVRSCGTVERVVVECLHGYVESRSSPQVSSYAKSWLPWGTTSAKPSSLANLLQRLSPDISSRFDDFVSKDDEAIKRELSNLVAKRNRIAHGEGENVTAAKALEFRLLAAQVCDWFVDELGPQATNDAVRNPM